MYSLQVGRGPRLLLTIDEGLGSLAAVRGLRAAGYEPVVGWSRPDTYAARSRAASDSLRLPDPQVEPRAHGQAIVRATERERFAAVLPGTEPSLRALADHPVVLPHGSALGVDSPAALARATDKRLLHRLASEAGLDVLRQTVCGGGSRAAERVDLDFPVVVKPLRSVEPGAGAQLDVVEVRPAHTPAELEAAVAQAPERTWLVEPLVKGTLEAICGVAWRGEAVCLMHQESPRIWPPGQGISCFARTVRRDPEREARVRALLAALGWSGIFGLQFLRVGARSYAIDFNPRVYGSLGLAVAAGQNLPAIWADLLLGRRPVIGPYDEGVRYRVVGDDLRALARGWREGCRGTVVEALLPRRGTVHGAFRLGDPGPSLAGLHKVRRRLA